MKDLGLFEILALGFAAASAVLLVWAEHGRRAAVAALAMALGLLLLTIPGCGDDKAIPCCTNLHPAQIGELCGFDVEGYPAVPCSGFVDNDGCLVPTAAGERYCVPLCTPGGDR